MCKRTCHFKYGFFQEQCNNPTTDYLGDWSEWTPCIARGSSCGGNGQQARFKYCDYPDTSKWQDKEKKIYKKRNPNQKRCPDGFKKSETRSCAAPACWEEWSEWSTCLGRCGGDAGKKSRTRSCIAGESCPTESTEIETVQCVTDAIACCSVSVKVTDAITRRPVQGANVSFTISGETEKTVQTEIGGIVNLGSLKRGTRATLTIQDSKFDTYTETLVTGETCGSPIVMAINPISKDGRIILRWEKDQPRDLDINMVSNKGCRLTYFSKRCGSDPKSINSLDVDNSRGGTKGPEVITIQHYVSGAKYLVYIIDYNRGSNRRFCEARAQVTISPGNGAQSQTVKIEDTEICKQDDPDTNLRFWVVGCFDSSTKLEEFKPINKMEKYPRTGLPRTSQDVDRICN